MNQQRLRIGVLGCGPIAQFAHFEAVRKAKNAELYAICDLADDLRNKMIAIHDPTVSYSNYEDMLADPNVDAVIVATSDQFHVPAALQAVKAGKHVLVEKPLGVTVEEILELREAINKAKVILQVGNMKRFDPGIKFAKDFIQNDMGEKLALKAWYCDSTYRYSMTEAVQPIPYTSTNARKPSGNPKANKRQYFMLTHGSHLVDTARYLGGEIVSVQAKLVEKFAAYCWFVETQFADGSVGHLDLTVAVRMDWHEGFEVYGEFGSVIGKTYNPWYFKSSDVECFSTRTGSYTRPLGEDAHFFRLQVEGFANTILNGASQLGANAEDGLAAMQAMVAISRSSQSNERIYLKDVTGGV
jgi:predicted dehydrogenase